MQQKNDINTHHPSKPDFRKIQGIVERNKKKFIQYNNFRKKIFSDFAPEESEMILHMLPWLLSINHRACPGFIPSQNQGFKVYNIDNEPEIRAREPIFQRKFGIRKERSLLKSNTKHYIIEGLYTIGSVGTVCQVSSSDCDIWICYDRRNFDKTAWHQLNQKINLIKDWMDINLKIPVYFFISDADQIKNGRFGNLDAESSGSAQKDVLKEEFYRTCIVICGKIPLWWVCLDSVTNLQYEDALPALKNPAFGLYDIIDFGNLKQVERSEYFGAALWQLHKSLSHPLKSIIKMSLLEKQLASPHQQLVCTQHREQVLLCKSQDVFPDPLILTMLSILGSYAEQNQQDRINLLKKCFYLRCELKPYDKRHKNKKLLTNDLFKRYPIEIGERLRLSKFETWDFDKQVILGNQLFSYLIKTYKKISDTHTGVATEIDKEDLRILGRIILAYYKKKPGKIPVLQKPTGTLNLSRLTLTLEKKIWCVYTGNDKARLLISNKDILYNVAFIVWNDLFDPSNIHMEPNPSNVTLQEIINLGIKMKSFFGTSNIKEIEFSNFINKERVTKLAVIVSFENPYWEKDINDFGVIYKNNWGELFFKRFRSKLKLETFIKQEIRTEESFETTYYVQRNCTYYEKIIERTRKIISAM